MTCPGIALALPVLSCEKYEYALSDNKKYYIFFWGGGGGFFTSQINKPFLPYNNSEHSVIKRNTLHAFEALVVRQPRLKTSCTLGTQLLSIAVNAEAFRFLCYSQ